ncbi:MAG: hypothetical protein US98_C0023G0008 [Parcubacteria group bacterium GW2011_GWC1_38_6]|nr:MAG: hypothetical protein UR98_C0002G0063 [Parcubacteria group bacterium GW2011_GWA1_36_12]KKQ76832.1 MAG: hypothetical protein US98_C0023G0008 [Parcubacteria group bacterium GW2011_GWC1_38_6]
MTWLIIGAIIVAIIVVAKIANRGPSMHDPHKKDAVPKPPTTTPTSDLPSDYGARLSVSENFKKGENKPKQPPGQSPAKKPSATEKDPMFEEMMGWKKEGYRPNQTRK